MTGLETYLLMAGINMLAPKLLGGLGLGAKELPEPPDLVSASSNAARIARERAAMDAKRQLSEVRDLLGSGGQQGSSIVAPISAVTRGLAQSNNELDLALEDKRQQAKNDWARLKYNRDYQQTMRDEEALRNRSQAVADLTGAYLASRPSKPSVPDFTGGSGPVLPAGPMTPAGGPATIGRVAAGSLAGINPEIPAPTLGGAVGRSWGEFAPGAPVGPVVEDEDEDDLLRRLTSGGYLGSRHAFIN